MTREMHRKRLSTFGIDVFTQFTGDWIHIGLFKHFRRMVNVMRPCDSRSE